MLTVPWAPVMFAFCWVPYPTTTTSERDWTSGVKHQVDGALAVDTDLLGFVADRGEYQGGDVVAYRQAVVAVNVGDRARGGAFGQHVDARQRLIGFAVGYAAGDGLGYCVRGRGAEGPRVGWASGVSKKTPGEHDTPGGAYESLHRLLWFEWYIVSLACLRCRRCAVRKHQADAFRSIYFKFLI